MQKYFIKTYGCQMNHSDSERIDLVLQNSGLEKSSLENANWVILNLCSVRQTAIDRVWGKIHEITKKQKHTRLPARQENTKTKIILTGCILESDKKKFKDKVDYILDINDLPKWPFITKSLNHLSTKTQNYLYLPAGHASKFEAWVPIMTGCNNFCSYCVVPYTRGREKSRPADDILNEVNKLVVQGYKFITLLGQNVNSYQSTDNKQQTTNNNKQEKINFPKLLKMIDRIPGDYWLSFVTSHPKDLSVELIKCFKECKHLIPYLHLPIQSGSDQILKLMNRKYTAKKYLDLISQVRRLRPDIHLSTDVIVGFPNETKKDFEESMHIMKKVKYDMAYIAKYSTRAGTAAAKYENNVSRAEKKQRDKKLNEILKKTALENNKKMIGKTVEVLIEKKKDNAYFGKTRNFKNIKLTTNNQQLTTNNLMGKIVKVKVAKVTAWNLEGKIKD